MAERLDDEALEKDGKISKAFKMIVCRDAKEEEKTLLMEYYGDQLTQFESDPENAKKFIDVGEYPPKEDRNDVTVAALMQVIHTIYNMEEAITKS